MKSILVAGLGSEIGADVAGWEVVRCLEAFQLPEVIRLLVCRHPGELLPHLPNYDLIVVVDACRGQGPAGAFRQLGLAELGAGEGQTHGLGVREVAGFAQSLGLGSDRLQIFGLEVGETFDPVWGCQAARVLQRLLVP